MASEREQKQLEASTEVLRGRIQDVRDSVQGLLRKLETDPHLNWPSFLDSYSLVSSQMNSLIKQLKHERTPALKKWICLPLALAPDRDEELSRMTENRVSAFAHDLVPDYLRTKPDPEVESRHAHYETKAGSLSVDTAQEQLTVMDKVVTTALKILTREREEMESRATARAEIEKTVDVQQTYELVAAISYGKGLRPQMQQTPQQQQQQQQAAAMRQQQQQQQQRMPMGKAPGAIKTNIKTATQVHPYRR